MSKKIDLTGRKFTRLTVINRCDYNRRGKSVWHCKCDCGNEKDVVSVDLINGGTKSCGCLNSEKKSKRITDRNRTHNKTHTRLYSIYRSMKYRCYYKNNPSYNNYGGRGISVCEEWLNDFMAFYNWAMDNGYKDGLTIDRINNNGNYEPSNCRWATRKQQQNNMRSNVFLEVDGEKHTIAEWSEITGLNHSTICGRLRRGKSPKEAIKVY